MTIFRFKTLALTVFALAACDGSDVDMLKCEIQRDRQGKVVVSNRLFRNATADIVERTQAARTHLEASNSLAGRAGMIGRWFPGSGAKDFAREMHTLRELTAEQKARELALLNDGDTLLGTSDSWQCRTFADSVASLDTSQSAEQLTRNLNIVESHFLAVTAKLARK